MKQVAPSDVPPEEGRDDQTIQVFKISDDGLLTLTPATLNFESDKPSSITEFN